jgi:hypothetical protein
LLESSYLQVLYRFCFWVKKDSILSCKPGQDIQFLVNFVLPRMAARPVVSCTERLDSCKVVLFENFKLDKFITRDARSNAYGNRGFVNMMTSWSSFNRYSNTPFPSLYVQTILLHPSHNLS